jgi:glycosyltransferase involved in cell wall biosynthesis
MNISIVTSGHPPRDERIFWKFALSLKEHGYTVTIVCSTEEVSGEEKGIFLRGFNGENIKKREKINKLKDLLKDSDPGIIICCEPLTILAAHLYRKETGKTCSIISDITEWYPENVAHKFRGLKRLKKFYFLYLMNIYSINKADALIIGEKGKKKRYDLIAPFRKKVIISYYPVLKFFSYSLAPLKDQLVLCYAGLISFERGIINILRAAHRISEKYPDIKVKVKLLGKFQSKEEETEFIKFASEFKSMQLIYSGWTTYDLISENLRDVHICLDLRVKNFIYKNSLPIKIFEYMAAGKPFIFSDIDPIREELNYKSCGQLVEPNDIDGIADAVEKYLKDRELLKIHAGNGRRIIEQEKNWEKESEKLVKFLKGFESENRKP